MGTWRNAGDPSIYATVDLNVEPALRFISHEVQKSGLRINITHFVGRAVAECIARHPAINSMLRRGRLYRRKNVDVFFQAATDSAGQDLSGITLRKVNEMSLGKIADVMNSKVSNLREKGDKDFAQMKSLMGLVPAWLTKYLLNLSGCFMYGLNLWSPLLGAPKDPFGSVMITNIGSLGIDMAFVPLVPYSRVPVIVALGAISDRPVVREGAVVVQKMITLSVTIDHRVIDGVHASHMLRSIKQIFANPEIELKND